MQMGALTRRPRAEQERLLRDKKSFGCHQPRHRAQGRTSSTTRLTSSTQEQPMQGASSHLNVGQAQASVTLER